MLNLPDSQPKNPNVIDVDEALRLLAEKRRINHIPIMDAVFVRDGKVIDVTVKDRLDFKYTGLCNADFVELVLEAEGGIDLFRKLGEELEVAGNV